MNTAILFSLNTAACRPMLDWQLLTPETKFGLLADKMGGMTFWKQISQAFPSLSLFSSSFLFFFFFFFALFLRAALRYPLSERLEYARLPKNLLQLLRYARSVITVLLTVCLTWTLSTACQAQNKFNLNGVLSQVVQKLDSAVHRINKSLTSGYVRVLRETIALSAG